MKEYTVKITESAKSDMREIFSYICFQLNEPNIAAKLIDKLEEEIEDLNYMPDRYHLYPNEPWHSKKVRYYTVGNYAIFYFINEESSVVSVLHVYYAKADLDARLRNEEENS